MLILGGYPPGHYADPTVKCDTQLVQLFDLNNWSVRTKITLLGVCRLKSNYTNSGTLSSKQIQNMYGTAIFRRFNLTRFHSMRNGEIQC